MLLVGREWDDMTMFDQFDVVEAILGEGTQVDAILDGIDDRIAELYPSEETWGASPSAQRAAAAMETASGDWGGPAQPKEKPPTVTPE